MIAISLSPPILIRCFLYILKMNQWEFYFKLGKYHFNICSDLFLYIYYCLYALIILILLHWSYHLHEKLFCYFISILGAWGFTFNIPIAVSLVKLIVPVWSSRTHCISCATGGPPHYIWTDAEKESESHPSIRWSDLMEVSTHWYRVRCYIHLKLVCL